MCFAPVGDDKVVGLPGGKPLFIDQGDTRVADSSREAIVFLHGLGSSHSFYSAALPLSRLSAAPHPYRLVRYDMDGHGLSPVSQLDTADDAGMLAVEDLVEDLAAVLERVGVDRVRALVGHSLGGMVACAFAARYPDKVDKLVLLGAMRALSPSLQTLMLKRAHTVLEHGMSAVVDQVVAAGLSERTRADSPLAVAMVRALVLATKPEGYAAACRALAGASEPEYSRIKAETLVVAGEYDVLSDAATSDHLCDEIPNARRVDLSGVGHWHAVEDPAGVARVLDEFLL
ncbi:hypothetical protein JCM3775_001631 [Rhodotorula graminis]